MIMERVQQNTNHHTTIVRTETHTHTERVWPKGKGPSKSSVVCYGL